MRSLKSFRNNSNNKWNSNHDMSIDPFCFDEGENNKENFLDRLKSRPNHIDKMGLF
jgi:hypothetical protein